MAELRALTNADRQQAMELWESRFHDSRSFIDWFFQARFSSETSFCAEENGRIVSIAHGSPMRLCIRGTELPAMMISGVATLPGFERRGLMRAVLTRLLSHCRECGVPVAFHTPARFAVYRSLGQYPCTDALFHRREAAPPVPAAWDPLPPVPDLTRVYRLATQRYGGCVLRTEAEMRRRIDDFRSDGGQCMAHRTDGALDGYLFAFEENGSFSVPEALAISQAAYAALVSRLPRGTMVKLPPDAGLPGVLRAQGTMIAVDVPYLLGRLCPAGASLALEVLDPVLGWNNGVFDASGRRVSAPPTDTLSAGRLMQFLCGYLPFQDLFEAQICFCADEY